jgi:phosphopantothenoylcysteine decarboxylase/phosphopantothenate--cysteine ligase
MNGKKIILAITGSIAAYKAALLVRLFMKEGAEVQVVMTPAAKEFITPLTLATLSRKPVISEFFSNRDGTWNSHVDLGLWADVMLIAPATASTIGKMANGIADNMLVTTYLSCKAPVFVAPAMDLDMFAHPATQQNLDKLRSFGNRIIEPGSGALASGLDGKGRMSEPADIVDVLKIFFAEKETLQDKKVLITAGPTYERMDPVRFIGNYSSGKMGFALAEAFAKRGADVTMITGPVSLKTQNNRIKRVDVESADEMYAETVMRFPVSDYAVLCAAVADYKPENKSVEKIKRENRAEMTIRFVSNRDIAAKLGEMKQPGQTLAGFALETKDAVVNAKEKLKRKNLDLIVLNSPNDKGAGFGVDTNKVTLIDKHGNEKPLPLKSKTEIADEIVEHLINTKTIWV